MSHSITIIFGKEQVNKFFNNLPFTDFEKEDNIRSYSFSSDSELKAFCLGINEAVGWHDCYILDDALSPSTL